MKVPPKRKGNNYVEREYAYRRALNESPSEKEGKFHAVDEVIQLIVPSMKVPPKRKGNLQLASQSNSDTHRPQ